MNWCILCANQDSGGSIHALAWKGRHRTANDAEHYFKVQNTDNGQKIYARGLAPEKGTADSGELYVSSNFIEAFKALCNTLATAFQDVRFQGNNKDHSADIVSALNNVVSKLNDTSLIATS